MGLVTANWLAVASLALATLLPPDVCRCTLVQRPCRCGWLTSEEGLSSAWSGCCGTNCCSPRKTSLLICRGSAIEGVVCSCSTANGTWAGSSTGTTPGSPCQCRQDEPHDFAATLPSASECSQVLPLFVVGIVPWVSSSGGGVCRTAMFAHGLPPPNAASVQQILCVWRN